MDVLLHKLDDLRRQRNVMNSEISLMKEEIEKQFQIDNDDYYEIDESVLSELLEDKDNWSEYQMDEPLDIAIQECADDDCWSSANLDRLSIDFLSQFNALIDDAKVTYKWCDVCFANDGVSWFVERLFRNKKTITISINNLSAKSQKLIKNYEDRVVDLPSSGFL